MNDHQEDVVSNTHLDTKFTYMVHHQADKFFKNVLRTSVLMFGLFLSTYDKNRGTSKTYFGLFLSTYDNLSLLPPNNRFIFLTCLASSSKTATSFRERADVEGEIRCTTYADDFGRAPSPTGTKQR
jgi:hypothetical protein